MQQLLILLVLSLVVCGPLAVVLAVAALARARRLEAELRQLERRVAEPRVPEEATPASPEPAARAASPSVTPRPTVPVIEKPAAVPTPPTTLAKLPPLPAPPPTTNEPSLEERLGARLPVWIGSIALTLAGAFLVKYSVDHGWLGPTARVALALLFGVALLVGGELLRRREGLIGQGLTAAGIADLFAALLAGVHLYHLIPPAVGFGLMALVTAAAVALSLRHGPLIALIGLVGGFLTPVLIGSREPRPLALFSYLFLLQCALHTITWRKRWVPLAALTLLASIGWALGIVGLAFRPGDVWVIGLFLLLTAASFAWTARTSSGWGEQAAPLMRWAGGGLGLVGMAALAARSEFAGTAWLFFGLLCAGLIVLGQLDRIWMPLVVLAQAFCGFQLIAWTVDAFNQTRFGGTTAAFAALFALGGLIGLRRPGDRRLDATITTVAIAGSFALVWFKWKHAALTPFAPWGLIALALGMVLVATAAVLARGYAEREQGETTFAIVVLGATGLIAAAIPLELETAWVGVAWAIQAALLALIHRRIAARVFPLATAILCGMVLVRLLLNPALLDYPLGDGLLFNWLLYGYGIPLVAIAVAARALRHPPNETLADLLGWGSWLLGCALLTLEIHHFWHRTPTLGTPLAGRALIAFPEAITFALAAIGLGWGLTRVGQDRPWTALRWGGLLLSSLGLGCALLISAAAINPILSGAAVGSWPLLNLVLPAYGVPALLCLPLARQWQRHAGTVASAALHVIALVLLLIWINMSVRQFFHGTYLGAGELTNAEMYAYSIAWALLGMVLLVVGIQLRSALLRYAALVVMFLTVIKVFLLDTSSLEDLWRVVSFLGLGLSLLLLAWLYRRFVATPTER